MILKEAVFPTVFFFAAPVALAASVVTRDEIKAALAGNTVQVATTKGERYTDFFDPSGAGRPRVPRGTPVGTELSL